MASSKDYQQIYDRYQTEGLPKQISIVKFCEQNGVPYRQYERWYKTCRGGKALPVEIVDTDAMFGLEDRIQDGKLDINPAPASSSDEERNIKRIEIIFKDGMRVRKTNLDYALLLETVQKLSALC